MRPGPAWIASLPLQAGAALARHLRSDLPALGRPCLSVGNLALGGRGKTPVVAELARAATGAGLRVAVLSRGYGGSIRRSDPPELLISSASGPAWLQPVRRRSPRVGDEPAWLAAVCPDVTIGVHPRRELAAALILEQREVDLFLLDDGFQAAVARDLDLVLVDPSLDPPTARRAALREGSAALKRAQMVITLGAGVDGPGLLREPEDLVDLDTGGMIDPASLPAVTLATGVGDPAGVARLARQLGLEIRGSVPIRDHGRPGRLRRRVLGRAAAVLVTEKDASGWAAERPPCPVTVVLRQRIVGVEALWTRASALLGLAP